MPIKHAAIKHMRQTKKRTDINRQIKESVKSAVKAVRKAILAKDKKAGLEAYAKAATTLDKAARKKIIAKNKAARLKSRLGQQVNTL